MFDKLICCKLHKLTERYDDEDDESDRRLEARDRRYLCLKWKSLKP